MPGNFIRSSPCTERDGTKVCSSTSLRSHSSPLPLHWQNGFCARRNKTANSVKRFCRNELDFGIGVAGLHPGLKPCFRQRESGINAVEKGVNLKSRLCKRRQGALGASTLCPEPPLCTWYVVENGITSQTATGSSLTSLLPSTSSPQHLQVVDQRTHEFSSASGH